MERAATCRTLCSLDAPQCAAGLLPDASPALRAPVFCPDRCLVRLGQCALVVWQMPVATNPQALMNLGRRLWMLLLHLCSACPALQGGAATQPAAVTTVHTTKCTNTEYRCCKLTALSRYVCCSMPILHIAFDLLSRTLHSSLHGLPKYINVTPMQFPWILPVSTTRGASLIQLIQLILPLQML